MSVNLKCIISSVLAVLLLCLGQIAGSTVVILIAMGWFLLILAWECGRNFTLPVLLFFLPWSPLMRLSQGSISIYTVGLVVVCVMSLMKSGFHMGKSELLLGLSLVALTLFSKLLDGSSLNFSYMAFFMMLILLPVLTREMDKNRYDFYTATLFYSLGIILAAFCAYELAVYPNIRKFITVISYSGLTRHCGFYGDPNYFSAQIVSALAAWLVLMLRNRERRVWPMVVISVLLTYCGLTSGSKSFLLAFAGAIIVWVLLLFRSRARLKMKLTVVVAVLAAAAFVWFTPLFRDMIETIVLRMVSANTVSQFTTSRTTIWKNYVAAIFGDPKILLLGKGLTQATIGGKEAHNLLIQILFQFGILGTPLLAVWCRNYFRGTLQSRIVQRSWENVLLAVGIFLPWMALSMLFFDEFFLLQWFFLLGMKKKEE